MDPRTLQRLDAMAAPVSEYEAKRLARVRENQQKLLALGMEKLVPKRERVAKRERTQSDDVAVPRDPPRRSTRISMIAEAATSLRAQRASAKHLEVVALSVNARRSKRNSKPLVAYQELDLPSVDVNVAAAQSPKADVALKAEPSPVKKQRVSSQFLDIDFDHFHTRWLGNQVWPKGKQTIMAGACPRHTPLFSRMSGIQLWRNAVVLFVNVQGESMYDNVFHQEPKSESENEPPAVYFQWFAQQRQHVGSPAIVRLLNAQKGHEDLRLEDASYYTSTTFTDDTKQPEQTLSSVDPVLLFIRHVDGPYIYCGRLGYLGYRTNSSPLEFRWQLLDIAALDWDKIKTLVDASSAQVDGAAVVV
ncbi:hypothetical protein FI667_g10761, partial [Globisporangium splendens]